VHSESDSAQHWRQTYDGKAIDQVSWYQTDPQISLRLIADAGADPSISVIDIGAGASVLADRLLDRGLRDITVLDIAETALTTARTRLADRADAVTWVTGDLLSWKPARRYDIWHDRAVFHFLTDPADRDRYRRTLAAALADHGHLVIGTFAEDGPQSCSGLLVARYSPGRLAAEFAGFEVVDAVREEHRTPWAAVQPFTWLLMRRVQSL
jgi:2-polyprenyl-3-methyl-5-hydroxy-6-metoxy-1,4-benzoquinol methylase